METTNKTSSKKLSTKFERPNFLTPFLVFLNKHKKTDEPFPHISEKQWRAFYALGPSKAPKKDDKKFREMRAWMAENGHYRYWLNNPVSMYAPRQYIVPELRKVLIVTPRDFGAHFLPLYNRDLFKNENGTTSQDDPHSMKNPWSHNAYLKLRDRVGHVGIQYLVAHCHGMPTRLICKWTGKTEVEIHKDVVDSLDGFVNTIPYWIWAYKVDMKTIPFTQNRVGTRGCGRMSFRNRLRTWNALNERPQFTNPQMAERFMPPYLRDPRAISALQKKKRTRQPIDRFLYPVPYNHTPSNPILKSRALYSFTLRPPHWSH